MKKYVEILVVLAIFFSIFLFFNSIIWATYYLQYPSIEYDVVYPLNDSDIGTIYVKFYQQKEPIQITHFQYDKYNYSVYQSDTNYLIFKRSWIGLFPCPKLEIHLTPDRIAKIIQSI